MIRFDHLTLYRVGLIVMLTQALFACSGGGGCSGCAGCGIQPIPGGYPIAERIDNSAQVRLTSSGISFIEDNIDGILGTFLPDGLDFPIPPTDTTTSVPLVGDVRIRVCTDGDCTAHIEIKDLQLTPTAPNEIQLVIQVIVDSRDASGARRPLPVRLGPSGCSFLGCVIDTTCQADIDTRAGARDFIAVGGRIVFNEETRAARAGYTRVDVQDLALVPGQDIEDADISLGSCSGISGAIIGALAGLLKSQLTNAINDQIGGALDSALGDSLCTTRGEFGCPTGTFAVPNEDPTSVCRFGPADTDECVPVLLGTDGQGDLGGQLIGGFSPGTHAYAQFLLASGGEGEAVNDGMSLFFYGGFRGTDPTFAETPAHNACVPVTDPPPMPTIPRVDAFRGNVIPGTSTETHVGIGIAEAYLDYAGWGLFDSGALCIGAGTRLSQQLSTGLLSALIMSLPDLTYPFDSAPVTIALRPQAPPDFTIGAGTEAEPLIDVLLPQLQMDFYVWSTERYVRFMTLQTDLDIGINLSVEAGEIVPSIVRVSSDNAVVTHSELLEESPAVLASTLSTIITGFAGMLGGGLSPVALPSIMGFDLTVPEGGITRVVDGGESFLGIFANLALAAPAPYTQPTETRLEVGDLHLDRESMDPAHWNEGEGNSVWLYLAAEGVRGVDYEYSYRIDGGPWSSWDTAPRRRIDDEILLLQARHVVEARSRVVGEPGSVDPTPARAELVVDILPPEVEVARTVEGIEVRARDLVSPPERLEYRYFVNGSWGPWGRETSVELPVDPEDARVEVRDESGNVGAARAALIRGLPNPAASGGCGCHVSDGSGARLPFGLLALLGLFGVFLFRRRRASVAPFLGLLAIAAAGLLASGCDCGGPQTPCGGSCIAATPPVVTAGAICCEATDMCAMYDVDALCDPGYTCPVDNLVLDEACGVSCSECMAKPAIDPGILATHLDMAVDSEANVYVSGYNPGNPSQFRLGDLVFGRWNGSDVDWEIVDGAPTTPITNDPTGWRGGVSDPGDDVGRWTSLANQSGTFLIAYYDATHGALRLAAGGPGAWATQTVDETGDSGRYASLALLEDGTPAIAYLRMSEDPTTPGRIRGAAMVAVASTPNPSGPADWTITEVASAPMPCRPSLCERGQVCLESGECALPTSDCAEACGTGTTCVMGTCAPSLPSEYVEDMPPAYGLYTSLAVTSSGLALVFYDRTSGNLYGASYTGAAWGEPFLIDGYAMDDPNVGDCGQGADLAVDTADLWHVVYIDGSEETLRYAQVQSDGTVLGREIVDDGSTSDGSTRFDDGRHIIGDDASIVVDAGGGVRVAYQDATSQDAVVAVRPAGGGSWAIARFDSDGSTGYWVAQRLLGTVSYAVTHWRQRGARGSLETGVRVTALE